MTLEQILSLVNAGYSKADIDVLGAGAPAEPTEPTEPAEPAEPVEPNRPGQDSVLEAINNLAKIIQRNNINNNAVETPAGVTAQDVLNNMIRK